MPDEQSAQKESPPQTQRDYNLRLTPQRRRYLHATLRDESPDVEWKPTPRRISKRRGAISYSLYGHWPVMVRSGHRVHTCCYLSMESLVDGGICCIIWHSLCICGQVDNG